MSAVIQAIMATIGSGGSSGPPPTTQLDAGFFGDDTNRGLAGQNGWWIVNGGTYNYSTFSGNLAWNTFTYKDGSYTGHTYDFTNGDYMISPSLSVNGTWASNTISINFWFYPTASGVQLMSELGQNTAGPNPGENTPWDWGYHYSMLEITSMGNVKARFYDGDPVTSTNTVTLNQWNHIYFAEDSQGGHTFELNGIATNGNPTYTRSKPSPEYFSIGGVDETTNMGNTGGFVGKIGWLEIHDYPAGSTYLNTKAKFIDPVLIVNLDVANPTSYSGTGTTWNMLGTANSATLVNTPTYYNTGGVKALNFSGGSYATLPADVYFDQDFTIIAWVKVTSVTSWARIIDFGNGPNGDNVLLAASDGPSGKVALRSGSTQFDSNTVLTPDTWYHITGRVKADGRADIFINGSVDATNYGSTLPASVTRINCYIAKSNWENDAYLDGLVGELRIYRGALSDAKVYDDYYDTRSKYAPPTLALNLEATASYLDSTSSPTTWTDSVGNIPFTLYGGVGYNSGNGGYLTFQASSSRYAASTTGPALTQWVVETWMYWNGQNVGSNPCIVSDQFVGAINYALGTLDSDALQTGHFNGGWHTTAPYTLPASNAWYHIVGTYNGQDVKLYVNGVCVATTHDPGITPQKGGAGINLMKRWDNPDFWGGRLSIVRIFSGEMGAAQVKLRYDATKSQFGLT
jgi:hypothetical protein